MAPPAKQEAGGSILLPAAVIAAGAALVQLTTQGPLAHLAAGVVPSASKSYASFDAFWPHYLAEHSHPWTRRLHYLGSLLFLLMVVLSSPALLLCVAAGLTAGYAVSPLLRGQPTGALEMALMIGLYLVTGRRVAGSWSKAVWPMVVAYAFAWTGHFFIEGNRPATFLYPSYSLMGDWRMLFEALRSGQL